MESTKELKRQVQDVMAQSERLVSSQTFESDFKEFKVYVEEMQNFVGEHIEDPMVLERINGLPALSYRPISVSIYLITLFPLYVLALFYNYMEKKNALQQVRDVLNTFSSIDFLLGKSR